MRGRRRSRIPRPLAVAAVLSGASALIFESLWARSLAIVLGSTVHASSLVFAAFMLGLAAGAFVCGRIADHTERATRLYAIVEIGIGITGVAVGVLLQGYAGVLAGLAGPTDSTGGRLAALAITVIAVGIPTSLMGATFPLLLEAARRMAGEIEDLYGIYAWNTLGAAAGALATALLAIPFLGVRGSLLLAASFNGVAAFLVIQLRQDKASSARHRLVDETVSAEEPEVVFVPKALLLASACASGLVILSLEVLWSRLASFFLGNRTLSFSVLVAWVLTLLALGSWTAGRLSSRARRVPYLVFGTLWVLSAFSIVLSGLMAAGWIDIQLIFEHGLPAPESLLLFYRILETGLLLGPMMLVLGCIFPMSLLSTPDVTTSTGTLAGRFYLVNTLGSVVGSLLTGFWAVNTFGTYAWMGVQVVVCALLGLLFFAEAWRSGAVVGRPVRLGLAAGIVVLLASMSISFRELGAVPRDGAQVIHRTEDAYGVMQIHRQRDGALAVFNNRTELVFLLGRLETSYVQQMQAHLGVVYNPSAKRALVLGSGYGITAGAMGLYPSIEHVDAVEIIPAMVHQADLFEEHNFGYHKNPKIDVYIDDARHFLARRPDRYDIISANPSDPHIPGSAALFHREFYDLVKERLNPGGVLVQHCFGSDLAIVLATLRSEFADIRFTVAYGNGYNIVASTGPLELDREAVLQVTRPAPVHEALIAIGYIPPVDIAHMAGDENPDDVFAIVNPSTPLASDDRPVIEYSWTGTTSEWLFSNE